MSGTKSKRKRDRQNEKFFYKLEGWIKPARVSATVQTDDPFGSTGELEDIKLKFFNEQMHKT